MSAKARKNGTPATASELSQRMEENREAISDKERATSWIEASLPQLCVEDPPAYAREMKVLASLVVELSTLRRTLPLLENAQQEAVARERREDFERRLAAQDRESERLARNAAPRFKETAGPLLTLIEELQADRARCDALRREAAELGLQGVDCAETRARRDTLEKNLHAFVPIEHARIPGWEGSWLWHKL